MNKTLLRDGKRWRMKQIDEFDEQKCTQKVRILSGPTKKWRIKWVDELNDDELDEFYCITLDHNFRTRNPSRSSKVSKNSDCSLVSNKNFSKLLPSSSFGPRPGEVGQGGLKVLHLRHHSQKTHTPNHKNCSFFVTFF